MQPFLHHINTVKELEMDEWYQEKLRYHALRVMAVVEKTINRLDNEEKAAQVCSVPVHTARCSSMHRKKSGDR